MKYKIIVTKDRHQYRLMKTYSVKHNALNGFKNIIHENAKVKFEKQFLNYLPCIFHIELLSPIKFFDVIEFEKDELGRNIASPDRNGLFIWRLKNWKEPEVFTIYGIPGKFDCEYLIKLIKGTKDLVSMSTIQNMLILDINGRPLIVTLKNVSDAIRLYNVIRDENLKNILPFGVMSKENRKPFYKKIESLGIPIKMFYTKSTRW